VRVILVLGLDEGRKLGNALGLLGHEKLSGGHDHTRPRHGADQRAGKYA
jgi:hypothetical protein